MATTLPSLTPGSLPQSLLANRLEAYKAENKLVGKGQLATIIYASRLAREKGLPFDVAGGVVTDGQGQVRGLGKSAVQNILHDYGITKVLAEEGGRTSRGSLGNIKNYLDFLNALHAEDIVDAAAIEAWWVEQAKGFFNAKPFELKFEAGKALRLVIRDLLAQAKKRQADGAGTMFVGAMLQHLVGAKLALVLPEKNIVHHGYSVADAPGGRSGDFEIGNAILHVTTTPGEAVIRKCAANLNAGKQPIVVTLRETLPAAEVFATEQGIADRLDIFDAEQFIVTNLHELGRFESANIRVTVDALVDKYNEIVGQQETDPSLKISKD
jgi:hypothetical protein